MMKKLEKLMDVKSIITISLITVLAIVVLGGLEFEEKVFNLFSNITTMVITYFFTKKSNSEDTKND